MKAYKEKLYLLIKNHPSASFFLFLALILILYPRSDLSHFIFPRDPSQYFSQKFFVWNDGLYFGLSTPNNPSIIVFSFFDAKFHSIFDSTAKNLSFVFWSILSGLSVYYLASLFSSRKIAKMSSAVFYVFSFYNLTSWETLEVARISLYTTLPIMLALFIKGLEEKSFKHIILLSVVLIVSSGIGSAPSLIMIVPLIFAIYVVIYTLSGNFWRDKDGLINIAKYSTILLFIAVLVNAYWTLPLLLISEHQCVVGNEFNPPIQAGTFFTLLLPLLAFIGMFIRWYERYVVFASIISIIGLALSTGNLGYLWIGGISPNSSALLTILGYSILAGIAVEWIYDYITVRKGYKTALIFLSILFAVYISSGNLSSHVDYAPYHVFGVAEWMESKEGIFRLVIMPKESVNESFWVYSKFLTLAGKPIILKLCNTNGTSPYEELVCNLSDRSFGIVNVKYIAVDDVDGLNGSNRGLKLEAEINGYSIYSIPTSSFLPRIYPAITPIPIEGNISDMITFVASGSYQVGNNVIFLSNQTKEEEQWQLLKDYVDKRSIDITVHNASEKVFNWEDLPAGSIEAISYPDLGKTVIYIKTGPSPVWIAYISENGSVVNDITDMVWVTVMGNGLLEISRNYRAIIEIGHVINGNVTLYLLHPPPTITFKKVNPTKYIVKVENAREPFFLVFSESYHPQWKAYVEDSEVNFSEIVAEYPHVNVREAKHDWYKFTPEDITFLLKKPLDDRYHFMANGYANAWYIDPANFDKDGDGEFVVTLYFLSQSLFYLGLFVSGATLFGCVSYLIYDWRRRIKQN